MTDKIHIRNTHPTLKLRLCVGNPGWCEDDSKAPGAGPRFKNTAGLVIEGGTFEGGTFWGGTFWGGTFRGGTFWGGTFEGGTFEGGTFKRGTFEFALTASRSDGYVFTVNDNGTKIVAGCRYFAWKEAEEHWRRTRGDTPLGVETFRILAFLKEQAEAVYGRSD